MAVVISLSTLQSLQLSSEGQGRTFDILIGMISPDNQPYMSPLF